ncbi:Peroxidasin-like protein [Acropora cervicornis]|uniref:Peroxidasin-like protein n=1 Tax=Acropora cervicornis TaxID=6130 RepID=A0AAD9QJE0_ACRCE|nr:Peroxidasin-like protein [Acropora cervicornis]
MVWSVFARDLIATFDLHNCDDLSERILCAQRKYRTIDGTCNNLCNITKAAILTPLLRTPGLFPPTAYGSPDFLPRSKSVRGGLLPNPRLVRIKTLPADDTTDLGGTPSFTHITMTWGQFIDHDIALTEMELNECGTNEEVCPNRPRECISIPIQDPKLRLRFNPEFNCIPLRRSNRDKNGDQINVITHYVDGSMVYGSDSMAAPRLRAFKGGLLDTQAYNVDYGHDEILPDNPDTFCLPNGTNEECWLAGDIRVNENHDVLKEPFYLIALTTMHLLWVREHNRLARNLQLLNPQWNDERLYQEARRIVVAEIQHIHYNEWLPALFDRSLLQDLGLALEPNGTFFEDYDPNADASMRNAFATAAYRMGHSLVRNEFILRDTIFRTRGFFERAIPLAEFYNPVFFFREFPASKALDGILVGLVSTPGRAVDRLITETLTDNLRLEGEGGAPFTIIDLPATNIARARDHGIPGYLQFRKVCGLSVATGFNQLQDIPASQQSVLANLYADVRDIDVFVGLLSEQPQPRSRMGPTLTCLITRQFNASRRADRFWYERRHEFGFTLPQLDSIRNVTLAKVICQNMKNIVFVPREAFQVSRLAVNCDALEPLDLALFQETEEEEEEIVSEGAPSPDVAA